MRMYHVPKAHHTNPDQDGKVAEIYIGKIINTVCGLTIKVQSRPQSISKRDAQISIDTMPCPGCSPTIQSATFVMAYLGEDIPRQNQTSENQATA